MMTGGGGRRAGGGLEMDVELNIASIVDCLVVLITYVLAASSFLSLGMLEAGLTEPSAAVAPSAQSELSVSVELKGDHSIKLSTRGTETLDRVFPANELGTWNLAALVTALQDTKGRRPAMESVSLFSANTVRYQDLIAFVKSVGPIAPIYFVKETAPW